MHKPNNDDINKYMCIYLHMCLCKLLNAIYLLVLLFAVIAAFIGVHCVAVCVIVIYIVASENYLLENSSHHIIDVFSRVYTSDDVLPSFVVLVYAA